MCNSELNQPPGSEWHLIDSAPKDRDVRLWNSLTGEYRSKYDERPGCHWPLYNWCGRQGIWYPSPTHWAELKT